jgi:hypothetical protein
MPRDRSPRMVGTPPAKPTPGSQATTTLSHFALKFRVWWWWKRAPAGGSAADTLRSPVTVAGAWRAAGSLAIRSFLGLALNEEAPDHSTISRTRGRIDVESHKAVAADVNVEESRSAEVLMMTWMTRLGLLSLAVLTLSCTPTTPSSTSALVLPITNSCGLAPSVSIRFFDKTNNLVWPSASTVYTLAYGSSNSWSLTCNAGAKICYGASLSSDAIQYWGDGINGDLGCTDCCVTCADKTAQGWNLTC